MADRGEIVWFAIFVFWVLALLALIWAVMINMIITAPRDATGYVFTMLLSLVTVGFIGYVIIKSLELCCSGTDIDEAQLASMQNDANKTHPYQPLCAVCLENVKCTRLNCGHTYMCYICAEKVHKATRRCPLCNARISRIQKNMFSMREYVP